MFFEPQIMITLQGPQPLAFVDQLLKLILQVELVGDDVRHPSLELELFRAEISEPGLELELLSKKVVRLGFKFELF